MPNFLTLLQQRLSTEPAVLLRTILRGRTPAPAMMKRHGWWLIMLFFVPTALLDVRDIALRKTAEEELDSERQRDKRRHKLDRIIGAVTSQQQASSEDPPLEGEEEAEEACKQFAALAAPLLLEYDAACTASAETPDGKQGPPPEVGKVGKWELVNESVKACYRFEKSSDRILAGVTALSHVLLRELAEATTKTDAGQEERYLDGEELESALPPHRCGSSCLSSALRSPRPCPCHTRRKCEA